MIRTLISAGALLCAFGNTAFASYSVISTQTTHIGNLARTETVVQESSHALNQFKYYRVRKSSGALKGIVFLLPPLSNSFTIYEYTETGNYKDSFAGELAKRGYDVWGYTPRDEGLAAGFCEAAPGNCDVLNTWGVQSMVDDVAYVRSRISHVRPFQKPVVGGFSMGAMLGVAVVNSAPTDYRALLLWEGFVASGNTAVETLNQTWCAVDESQLSSGVYFDGSAPTLRLIAQLATSNPNDPSPFPFVPPGTTNRQAYVGFLSNPPASPITNFVPGEIFAAGDVMTEQFTYASEARLLGIISIIGNYGVIRTVRDINCSLAGTETAFVNNLSAFTGPVLGIGGSAGFGAYLQGQIDMLGSTKKKLLVKTGYGHLDHYVSSAYKQDTLKPILRWLKKTAF